MVSIRILRDCVAGTGGGCLVLLFSGMLISVPHSGQSVRHPAEEVSVSNLDLQPGQENVMLMGFPFAFASGVCGPERLCGRYGGFHGTNLYTFQFSGQSLLLLGSLSLDDQRPAMIQGTL